MFQENLIYYPDNPPLASVLAAAHSNGLTPWPGKDDYRGLLREPRGKARGTLVLFHGNAGHAGHRSWYADEFASHGLRVILAEYPAYGPRPGKLGEKALVEDARANLALVRRQFPGPLLLVGESLGAGIASAVAKDTAADALLLITPWDDMRNVARHHYPWLPAGWLLRDHYANTANLSGFRGRIAVVIAEHDSIVPPELGRNLYDQISEPKQHWIIPGADHNDWMEYVDATWWQSVTGFLLEG